MYENSYSEILAFEGIQGSLLQSYRSIFVSSQSILFGIAVFIASQSQGSNFCFLLGPLGVLICVAWVIIDHSRGLDELFFDARLREMERGEIVKNVYTQYYEWIEMSPNEKLRALRKEPAGEQLVSVGTKPISTRGFMGTFLPCFFLILWCVIMVIVGIR